MLVAFSIAPAGGSSSDSVHDAVAAAVRVIRASGLPNRTDSMFTTIEGEWDECMGVIRDCVDAVSAYGTRVSLVLKADIRPGHTGEMTGKLDRLEAAIARQEGGEQEPAIGQPEATADQPPTSALTGAAAAGFAATGLAEDHADRPQLQATPDEPLQESAAADRPAMLTRFVTDGNLVTVAGAGEDDLPVRCDSGARVLVARTAPPELLGLVEVTRAVLRTDNGELRVLAGDDEQWRGQVGDDASVVVWADSVEEPSGLWIQLAE